MLVASGFNGTSLRKTPVVRGRWPVRSEARVGQHTGMPAMALMKRTLWPANRSRCGVFTFGSPAKPKAWARHWSASTKSTFGTGFGWLPAHTIPGTKSRAKTTIRIRGIISSLGVPSPCGIRAVSSG